MTQTNANVHDKIELYLHLQTQVDIMHNSLTNNVLIGVGIVTIGSLFGDGVSKLLMAAISIPLMIVFITYIFAYQNRAIAILEGYLISLEEEINLSCEKNYYIWNSKIKNKYYKKEFFPINGTLSGLIMSFVGGVLYVISFIIMIWYVCIYYSQYKSILMLAIIVYLLITLSVCAFICIKNFGNNDTVLEQVKKDADYFMTKSKTK